MQFPLQDKKFYLALKQYERAIDLVSAGSISKDEEKESVAPIFRTVKLNVAAVQLQLKNYERARDACDTVQHSMGIISVNVYHLP